jgi:hypothetical protein
LPRSPGRLDDHAIAARLSYFLTGGPPDATSPPSPMPAGSTIRPRSGIRPTASSASAMRGGGAGSRRFVEDFAAEWLDLDQIDFTEPDRKLFRDFDPIVQHSMLAETHSFLDEMLRENRPVSWLATADVTYLNSRLARFYGIPDVAATNSAD